MAPGSRVHTDVRLCWVTVGRKQVVGWMMQTVDLLKADDDAVVAEVLRAQHNFLSPWSEQDRNE